VNGHHYLAELQFVHTLVVDGSLISEDTKAKVDKGVYTTLGYSLLFKVGNSNKWIKEIYNIGKASNFTKFTGPASFDHTIFLQEKKVGFWYDSNNWN
jgi:hypothetical protein